MPNINKTLKRNVFFLFLFFTGSCAFAQQKKQPYEMMIEGVKVIVQPSNNKIVEIQTVIRGGVQNYATDKAGIENLAINALTECGTQNDSKNSFKNKLDKVSARIYGSSGMDFAKLDLNCIQSDFETIWPLYVDALTVPLFDQKEFDRIKQDAINNLRAQASQPDYSISQFAKQVAFAGKDYAKSPEGTEETVIKLTPDETKAYYKSLLTKSRIIIVVVAELDSISLKQKIKDMLSKIPEGSPVVLKKYTYSPVKNTFISEKKDFATNYIQGVTSAPAPGTADYNAFTLAMRIFYDRDFLEIRTNNGLSYAPYTYFDNGLSPSSNFVVSTTNPNKYIGVVDTLIDKTKKDGFIAEELKDMKTTYLVRTYYQQETNGAQASAFASNEVLHNNWRRAVTLPDDLKKVTLDDVDNAFKKYITSLTWVYQGNPDKVDPALFTGKKAMDKLPPSKVTNKKNN